MNNPNQLPSYKLFDNRINQSKMSHPLYLKNFNLASDLKEMHLIDQEISKCILSSLEYLGGVEINYIMAEYDLSIEKIKRTARIILIASKEEVIEQIYKKINFIGEIGLEKAIITINRFVKENNKIPCSKSDGMRGLRGSIERGEWSKYGIDTWNDLLLKTTGRLNSYKDFFTKNCEGYVQAQRIAKEFFDKHKRLPKASEKEIWKITTAISKGYWKDLHIFSWNDFLIDTFGKINSRSLYYTKEREGFLRAQKTLKDYVEIHNKLPTTTSEGMSTIEKKLRNGFWSKFDVNSWNDLLFKTFGKINVGKNIYQGKTGLEYAQKIAKEIYKNTGRLPNATDMRLKGIMSAIQRETWKEFGILKWNDFLQATFNKINCAFRIYEGIQGFLKAQDWARQFFNQTHRLPTYHEIPGFRSTIKRGEWKEFGINSWNDFLNTTFHRVNHRFKYFTPDEIGLEKAKEYLIEFKEKNHRFPLFKESLGIYSAICHGRWHKFQIYKWSDMLKLTFGEGYRNKKISQI